MPIVPVSGSEQFAVQPAALASGQTTVGDVALHTVGQDTVDGIDALTYEVIRHRLAAITEEMGDAIKRM